MEYQKANKIAVKVCNELQPHVDDLAVFGQLKDKRTAAKMGGKADIDRLDIVCMPKKVKGFLNSNCNPVAKPIVSFYFTQAVNSLLNEGKRISGTAYHDKIHIAFYEIDLHIYIAHSNEDMIRIKNGTK